jgi:hypothetical protein
MASDQPETTVECCACHGKGSMAAFVDGAEGGHFDPAIRCGLCLGEKRISATKADWVARGRTHYKARVARGEGVRDCARRLGLRAAELSGMEHGRTDPGRLEAESNAR